MSKVSHWWGWLKMIGLFGGTGFFILFYLITINNTSTKGYFLRQSMKELDDVKFRHNVATFQLAIAKRQLWDKVNVDFVGQWDNKARTQKTSIVKLAVTE